MSASPHIASGESTSIIMRDVVFALMPALLCGVYFFGLYALLLVLLSVGSCVLFEFLFCKIRRIPCTISDWSAVVTGLLLGLNLPPAVPVHVPIVGGLFAIVVVKMLFGGLGRNFANPAITARVFLIMAWPALMVKFVAPIDYSQGFSGFFNLFGAAFNPVDVVTSATPLGGADAGLLSLFLGNVAGCIGETSALALLLGGIYLTVRRIIDWKIPVLVLGSAAVIALIFGGFGGILPALLSGGLMLGSIFMATDYATSPNTTAGTIVYAVFIGVLTIILREYSNYPEGMSFAILLGNLIVPLLDKFIIPKPFGYRRDRKGKKEAVL